jgi:long-chain fatty acid transport protein
MGSFNGSLMAVPGMWLAWKPIPELRIGFGVMALAGTFKTTVTFSTSPATSVLSAPEDPQYDAAAQLSAGPVFAPTVNAGLTFVPMESLRIGVSGQGPMVVSAPAQLDIRLPSAPMFADATQGGSDAHIHFILPAVLRAGIEIRPARGLRVELAYVRELWSEQKSIDIDMKNVTLNNVAAGALSSKITIPNIAFPRDFQDSSSLRLGAEYHYVIGGYPVDARAGVSYETSGVPVNYVSISSLDFNKVMPTVGGSLYVGARWRFDGMFGHVFEWSTYVNPNDAQIQRINPIAGNPTYAPVNGGWYHASANLLGVGFNYKFD